MPKAVRFENYGGIEVLQVVDVPRPSPGPGHVLVRVKAAGINPGEASVREGLFAQRWPATFPSGQGSDLAGVVEEVGPGVTAFQPKDEVLGFTHDRASHAELVSVPVEQLVRRPPHVPWEQAGGLFVAGSTAWAAVHAVAVKKGDTVVVSGAAGGVGTIAAQLARIAGGQVIGLASPGHHEWLKSHGVIPIAHGEGVAERLQAAAGVRVDAFVDTYGHGYVELALALGVRASRIDTIIDFEAAQKHGVKTEGSQAAANAKVLGELAGLIEEGRLEIPIAKVYPLAEVQAAFRDLEQRHTLGKIVLAP